MSLLERFYDWNKTQKIEILDHEYENFIWLYSKI